MRNNKFRRRCFILFHSAYDRRFMSLYKQYKEHEKKSFEELRDEQEKQLRNMIVFAYENVPYYRNVFDKRKIIPSDIKKIEDLRILPVLNRKIVKRNFHDFIPQGLKKMNYINCATSGTNGSPMKYRVDKEQRLRSGALIYRGWGYAGYELGDRMISLSGSSLDYNPNQKVLKSVYGFFRNYRKFPISIMSDKHLQTFANKMNSYKPRFLRGYASSIYLFARTIVKKNIEIKGIDGVFTTSETLYPNMRQSISEAFDCDVFDCYGLSDGAVSAYECQKHEGLHISPENAIMEIVDEDHEQLIDGEGRILATSLNNFAMPFIRYDTYDTGYITQKKCSCGRPFPLLKQVFGKYSEHLISPEGEYIHGTHLFNLIFRTDHGVNEIDQFQVIQTSADEIAIKFACKGKKPTDAFLNEIRYKLKSYSDKWNIFFEFTDDIETTKTGKRKFIINKMLEDDR